MPASPLHAASVKLLLALLWASSTLTAQQTETRQPEKTTLATGIDRLAGQEATSRIQYVRLVLAGSLRAPSPADSTAPSPVPTLIAQCTLRPNGKSYFELFANFGSVTDLTFYPPWTPTS